MQQTEIDELIATNRRQVDRIEALTREAEDLHHQLDAARGLLFALRKLLAVIYIFTNLPLPTKNGWDAFHSAGVTRLRAIRNAANELQGASIRPDDAERWAEVFKELARDGLGYEPEAGALPKPVDDAAAAAGQ
jgi:hypothetical protein